MMEVVARVAYRMFFSDISLLRPSIGGLVYFSVVLGTMIGAPLAYVVGATNEMGVFALLFCAIFLIVPMVLFSMMIDDLFGDHIRKSRGP